MDRRVLVAVAGIAIIAVVATFYIIIPALQAPPSNGDDSGPVKVFRIAARTPENGNFNVSEINVELGDHVVIIMTSFDSTHGVLLETPWFSVVKLAPSGKETRVEFDALQRGTYQIFCANPECSPRHVEMVITLHIS